jgi:uncharacterized membrane protein
MRMNDHNAEQIIGQLLRIGVLLSAFVVLVGGALYLHHAAHAHRDFTTFHGVAPELKSIPEVTRGALRGEPESIIQFGLLLLIATPIARVAFSIAAFALERDWMYVGLTMVVLAVLLYSLMQST